MRRHGQENMNISRRYFLRALIAPAFIPLVHKSNGQESPRKVGQGGISLNYDNSHFFCWHPKEEMSAAGVDAWVDQFVGTQVDALFFCPNSQRSSVASEVRQTVWDGYDPEADNNQPFLAGVPDRQFPGWPGGPNERQHFRNWVHGAWLLHKQGIDPYARWIARCRKISIRPWLSMRMNDVHYVDNPRHSIHDRFWKEHPEYRRDPKNDSYNGQCLDYGISEVRAYQMAYVHELIFRYDLHGFELDWMRNPFYFRPGREEEGSAILTDFVAEVRRLLDQRQKQVGHQIQLSVRVPDRPKTARALGFDVAGWAQKGLIDQVVVSPFLFSQTDIPIEEWKVVLAGSRIPLEGGTMVTIRPFEGGPALSHSTETARGVASSLLDRGANRVYLFNFFDNMPYGVTGEKYRHSAPGRAFGLLLRQIGELRTMEGHSRRHVVTNYDTRAPGEAATSTLPCDLTAGGETTLKIPSGPKPLRTQKGQGRVVLKEAGSVKPRQLNIG